MEHERKFLFLEHPELDNAERIKITQGYIFIDGNTETRIRKIDYTDKSQYFYTVKSGYSSPITRQEFEYETTKSEYNSHIDKIVDGSHMITKTRYKLPILDGYIAEMDFYHDELYGLKTVEVEFESEEEALAFEPPEWFLEEVTDNFDYDNQNLAFTTKCPQKIIHFKTQQ